MPEVVKPRGIVLYAYVSGEFLPIACAKDVSFGTTQNFIQTASKSNGIYETFLPTTISQTLSGSGLCIMNPDPDMWNWQDFEDKLHAQEQFTAKVIVAGVNGSLRIKEYTVYVESLTVSGSSMAFGTYNYSLKIVGAPTITDVLPPDGETCVVFDIDGSYLIDSDGTYISGACESNITGDFVPDDFSLTDFEV
jgi:hypothetical protein